MLRKKYGVPFLLVVVLILAMVFITGCGGSKSSNANNYTTAETTTANDDDTFTAMTNTTVTSSSALLTAVSNAKAGDVITISGTIKITSTVKCSASGTSSSRITLKGGTLDFTGMSVSSSNRGIQVSGNYWTISGITIKNAGDNGICVTGANNQITNCNVSGCADTGIQIYNSSAKNNTVSGCTSSSNYDTANGGENADGFACKLSASTGNSFANCAANSNSDDGYDLYDAAGVVTFTSCSASSNGKGSNGDGNGFKLGPGNYAHKLTGCTATNNKAWGFTRNGNTASISMSGCTGSGNGKGLSDI